MQRAGGRGGVRTALAIIVAALAATLTGADPDGPPAGRVPAERLLNARRVAILGDSITHAGGWVADLVAWMERRGTEAEVINVGLPSETVSGLSEPGHAGGAFPRPDVAERIDRVLRVVRPDVVLACYGMNCGIYQPLDETRFAAFRDGMQRLHDAVERSGGTIIHLTPPVYDQRADAAGPAGATPYDDVLAAYSAWLLSKRADGWLVIDVHGPMRALLAAARARDPATVLAADTVHPDEAGHWAICRAVLAGFGDEAAAAADTPAALETFLPEVTARMEVLRDAYLAAAGHARPGLGAGLPIADAEARARALTESIRWRRQQLMGGRREGQMEWRNPIEWPRPVRVDPGPGPARAPPGAPPARGRGASPSWGRGRGGPIGARPRRGPRRCPPTRSCSSTARACRPGRTATPGPWPTASPPSARAIFARGRNSATASSTWNFARRRRPAARGRAGATPACFS
jgi:lysophospholipase L1-like esterase